MVTTTTILENTNPIKISKQTVDIRQQEIINNLFQLAEQEQANGNTSITPEKLAKLSNLLSQKQQLKQSERVQQPKKSFPPIPKYASLVNKFDINKSKSRETSASPVRNRPIKKQNHYFRPKSFSFKKLEHLFVTVLENLANLLDNLHLLSNLPMFPKVLNNFLKQTNKIWVLILVFLIRKTISQLLNVIRKIRKVNLEVDLLNKTTSSKTNNNNNNNNNSINNDLNKKYNKVLKDLRFDKMMLIIELIGNFLDLTFNFIEMNGIELPGWAMSILNFSSMAMTIYRMNKDDEYIDDDIAEDLI